MTKSLDYMTRGNVAIRRHTVEIPLETALESVIERIDVHCGAVIESNFEYPGRYHRWQLGFFDPPVAITTRGNHFCLSAANRRGEVLLAAMRPTVVGHPDVREASVHDDKIEGSVFAAPPAFDEATRAHQPSVSSVIRAILTTFASAIDPHLGLIGAFGYDLVFQLEPIAFSRQRPADQRDLVAFLPDRLVIVDAERRRALRHDYEFEFDGVSTSAFPRDGVTYDYRGQRLRPLPSLNEPPRGCPFG